MPSIASPSGLSAIVGFTLPQERLDHDESKYLTFDPAVQRPFERVRVPMTDLRPQLDSTVGVQEQLSTQGYAIARNPSSLLDSIPSEEGTAKYLEECCE